MKRWLALGAGLLALLWALFLYDGRAAERPTTPREEQPERPREASDRPTPAPQPQLERAPEPDRARADPTPEPRTAAAPPPMPASGHFTVMQRAFESESRDAAWAREQETRIPQLVAEAGFSDDAFDRNVTCRRTLCRLRLRVTEDDLFALMKLAAKVQTSAGLGLAYGAAEVVENKTSVVVYIPREGSSPKDLQAK